MDNVLVTGIVTDQIRLPLKRKRVDFVSLLHVAAGVVSAEKGNVSIEAVAFFGTAVEVIHSVVLTAHEEPLCFSERFKGFANRHTCVMLLQVPTIIRNATLI